MSNYYRLKTRHVRKIHQFTQTVLRISVLISTYLAQRNAQILIHIKFEWYLIRQGPIYTQTRLHQGASKSFRTESITKQTTNTRWEATQRVITAKLTRLTHKIATQLHLVAENCIICSSRSSRPVRKLLDIPPYSAKATPSSSPHINNHCLLCDFAIQR
jgi:hypothetical protein